jgi:hypothetical protein
MWREAAVALVKVVFQYLQEGTDDYREENRKLATLLRFKPGKSRVLL